MTDASERREQIKAGFFAIDSRMGAKVCPMGMNEAVAYLVLARGTGRDNATTAWSAEAIERYTGISRGRAKATIKRLLDERAIRLLRGGTKPKYELTQHAAPHQNVRQPLSGLEQSAVDVIAAGEEITAKQRDYYQAACRAVAKGWLTRLSGRFAMLPKPTPDIDLIWLPNAQVTGATGEIPPLELVRQTQDPMTLRVLIDMYNVQNLREDGGVSRRFTWTTYKRIKVGEQGQFIIWGFHSPQGYLRWDDQLSGPHIATS